MAVTKVIQEISIPYTTIKSDLSEPLLLQEAGTSVAAVISMEEYHQCQQLRLQERQLTAFDARRAANRAVFQDLVGCALYVGEPRWVPEPKPHWRIPYRLVNGEIAAIVQVDATTGEVALDEEARKTILQKVRESVSSS